MSAPVPTWWMRSPRPGNLGDVLTPALFGRLGLPVRRVSEGAAKLLGVGSYLGRARAGMHVFGSGAMARSVRPDPAARYWAVRGPVSRAMVEDAGGTVDAVGDPALLLPRVHDRPVARHGRLGIVPHYVDRPHVPADVDAVVIDPVRADALAVVDEIRACDRIASSSLHGLVVAQAYGIPYARMRFGGEAAGDGTKFADFAASVGVRLPAHERIRDARFVLGTFDDAPLLGAWEAMRLRLGHRKPVDRRTRGTYHQGALLVRALRERGEPVRPFAEDHAAGRVRFEDGAEVGLVYPDSFFERTAALAGRPKDLRFAFRGKAFPGRAALLDAFAARWPEARVEYTDAGRDRAKKGVWDEDYYAFLARAEFGLCPHQPDFCDGRHARTDFPAATRWTYRFAECCLVGAIPVVFRATPLAPSFTDGFRWAWDDEPSYRYRAADARRNRRLAERRFRL